MPLLAALASVVGIEVGELVSRARKNALIWGLIGGLALIAVVFVLVAIKVALAMQVGPLWAPVIIAAVAALVAVALYFVHAAIEERAKRRDAERRRATERSALVTTAAATALPILARSPLIVRFGLPIGGALAAVYLLGRKGRSGDNSTGS